MGFYTSSEWTSQHKKTQKEKNYSGISKLENKENGVDVLFKNSYQKQVDRKKKDDFHVKVGSIIVGMVCVFWVLLITWNILY